MNCHSGKTHRPDNDDASTRQAERPDRGKEESVSFYAPGIKITPNTFGLRLPASRPFNLIIGMKTDGRAKQSGRICQQT
jgi:hypothetical protein